MKPTLTLRRRAVSSLHPSGQAGLASPKPPGVAGFTLVEIMIVVLVVAILSWLAMVVIGRIQNRAARSLIQNNLRQLFQAKEYYYLETGDSQTSSIPGLAAKGYLRGSVKDQLMNAHSFEANKGWHYYPVLQPGQPVSAYQGTKPAGGPPTGEIIYYPGPPSSPSDVFGGGGPIVAAGQLPAQSQTPALPQPPAGSRPGTSPTAPWVPAAAVKLPAIREDSPRTFTQDELLKLIGAGAPNPGDPPRVTDVTVNPRMGTMTRNPDGSWTFTPAPDFHGTDVGLTVKVANRGGENTADARLDVAPVVDSARPSLTVTGQQQVVTFGDAGTGAVMNQGNLQTGGPMGYFAAEFTVLGGPQVATSGNHGATFLSYATAGSPDEFYVWNPADLTVRVHGREYATGINTQADGDSHRYTVLWDSSTGRLDVLKDGVVAKTITGVAQGYQIPGDGKLVLAQDQDSLGGGFDPKDAFHGQILNAALARTPPDRAQLGTAPLGTVLQGQAGLIIDIGAQGGAFVDHTGRHQLQQQGAITATTQQVDTAVGAVRPGATLAMSLGTGAPRDRSDTVTGMVMSGLPAGTVLSDGHGHSQTISSPAVKVDVTSWTTGSISAQLSPTASGSHTVAIAVTTTGPNGDATTATRATQLRIASH
jgi:prepilin-type N-terminal cleavage/methylation domain-containing protein